MKSLLNGFNILGFAIPLISELFMFVDHIIYWIANLSLQTFFVIEEKSAKLAVNAPDIQIIMDRVMVLAGVFALFMVSLRLINYLINTDKVKDLQKNSASVVTSIVIAIILLSSCKLIFRTLGDIEHRIFTNQLIPKLVYGPNNASEKGTIEKQSEQFVNNIWLLFYTPKTPDGCKNSNSGSCLAYNRVKNGESGSILSLIGTNYTDFDYLPVVSGIVGIVLIFYFLRFAIDLGIRIVQLFVLQILSPIPIIMSIDPSRKKQLTTFATTYFGVYTQVFLRVLTFYVAFIAVNLLQALPDSFDSGTSSAMLLMTDANMFVKIILIIGIFQAVSRLPKLIEDSLGLKLGIDTSAKGFGGVLKGILGGTAGLIGGAVAGGIAGGAGGAVAGAASGMWSAGMGAAAGKNAAAGVSATVAAIGKSHQLGGKIGNVGGLFPYMTSGVGNFFGANKKDAAELARFDKLSKDQDKLIEGYNTKLSETTTVEQLRGGIDTALDSAFAQSSPRRKDLSTFINSDTQYSEMQSNFQELFGAGGRLQHDSAARQDALNRINERRSTLEADYERQKQNFKGLEFAKYRRNLEGANTPGFVPDRVDANFQKALEDYNEYVTTHGMSDRTINSYNDGGAESFENAVRVNDEDKIKYQRQIEEAKEKKEEIKAEKSAFEGRSDVYARAHRGEAKSAKPWTSDEDNNNQNNNI